MTLSLAWFLILSLGIFVHQTTGTKIYFFCFVAYQNEIKATYDVYIVVKILFLSARALSRKTISVKAVTGAYELSGATIGRNSEIQISKGDVLTFELADISGHPFWIKTMAGTGQNNAVTTGISGVGQGKTSGVVIWDTAQIDKGTYYYQCEYHAGMVGRIIVDEIRSKLILNPFFIIH